MDLVLSTPPCPDPGLARLDKDRFHPRLRHIALSTTRNDIFDNSISLNSTTKIALPTPMDNTDPFKHLKARLKSICGALPGLEHPKAMISCNQYHETQDQSSNLKEGKTFF